MGTLFMEDDAWLEVEVAEAEVLAGGVLIYSIGLMVGVTAGVFSATGCDFVMAASREALKRVLILYSMCGTIAARIHGLRWSLVHKIMVLILG